MTFQRLTMAKNTGVSDYNVLEEVAVAVHYYLLIYYIS